MGDKAPGGDESAVRQSQWSPTWTLDFWYDELRAAEPETGNAEVMVVVAETDK